MLNLVEQHACNTFASVRLLDLEVVDPCTPTGVLIDFTGAYAFTTSRHYRRDVFNSVYYEIHIGYFAVIAL